MTIEKNTDERIADEFIERSMDTDALLHSNDPLALAKERGYKGCILSPNELVFTKKEATFVIVLRGFYNSEEYLMIEPNVLRPEWTEETEALALGGCQYNPFAAKTWQNLYMQPYANKSICTRYMPAIVVTLLLGHYELEEEPAIEMARKLLLFGTEHFGRKGVAGPEDFLCPWEWATKPYICYAPGEIEAITDICYDIIQTTGTVENLRKYDMTQFKKRLEKKASSIPPTIDIAIFGRHINGAGLKEYQSSITFSAPVPIKKYNTQEKDRVELE